MRVVSDQTLSVSQGAAGGGRGQNADNLYLLLGGGQVLAPLCCLYCAFLSYFTRNISLNVKIKNVLK